MASVVEICNMAISHLGTGKEISAITEASEEANACNRFYEIARDSVLEDYPWPFARKFATLNLIEEDPTDEWSYSYRYPADCLRINRLQNERSYETRQSRVPYIIGSDTSGRIIYTNKQNAKIEYTRKITTVTLQSASFNLALSFRLAMLVAPRLTKGDPTKIKGEMYRLYQEELSKVRSNVINEEQPFEEVESALIRARVE